MAAVDYDPWFALNRALRRFAGKFKAFSDELVERMLEERAEWTFGRFNVRVCTGFSVQVPYYRRVNMGRRGREPNKLSPRFA